MELPGGGGRYFREFRIGVCREGSWTLTLFKDQESENWYPFYGRKPKNDTLFKEKTKTLIAWKGKLYFFSVTLDV